MIGEHMSRDTPKNLRRMPGRKEVDRAGVSQVTLAEKRTPSKGSVRENDSESLVSAFTAPR